MATKMYKIECKVQWAKLREDNLDTGFDSKKTKINCYLDKDNLQYFKDTKSRKTVKMDEDEGEFYVTLTRNWDNPVRDEWGGAPSVVLKTDEGDEPFEGNIGNGSTCEVFFTVYESKTGKGTRLEGVRILDLVEYTAENSNKLPWEV